MIRYDMQHLARQVIFNAKACAFCLNTTARPLRGYGRVGTQNGRLGEAAI